MSLHIDSVLGSSVLSLTIYILPWPSLATSEPGNQPELKTLGLLRSLLRMHPAWAFLWLSKFPSISGTFESPNFPKKLFSLFSQSFSMCLNCHLLAQGDCGLFVCFTVFYNNAHHFQTIFQFGKNSKLAKTKISTLCQSFR